MGELVVQDTVHFGAVGLESAMTAAHVVDVVVGRVFDFHGVEIVTIVVVLNGVFDDSYLGCPLLEICAPAVRAGEVCGQS